MDPPPNNLACIHAPDDEASKDLAPHHTGDSYSMETNQLRRENTTLRAAVTFLMLQGVNVLQEPRHASRPALSTLPVELVRLIFKESIPASYEYNLSLPDGPLNPWLQVMGTKTALPLICHALYWEGMAVLYSEVVLRRMSQIFLLARALRSPRGPDLCFLIKAIAMDNCPVGGLVACAAKEELGSILRRCHALRSLSYHPHPNFPLLADERQSNSGDSYFNNPTWFFDISTSHNQPPFLDGTLASRLRRLDLQFTLTPPRLRNLHNLLLITMSLQSLTLDYPDLQPLPWALIDDLSSVYLPALVELYVPFGQDANFDEYICTRWDAPKLARLTLMSFEWWPERPLGRFGKNLVYLHLFVKYFRDPFFCNHDPCPGLASLCPILEHLVIPNPHNCLKQTPQTTIASPTLKYLDIWDFGTNERLASRARYYPWLGSSGGLVERVRSENSIPCLRTVRSLFTEFGRYRGIDWPSICHPDLLFDHPDDEIWHSFPEAYVAQTATRLTPHSPRLLSDDDISDELRSESGSDGDWTLSSSSTDTDDVSDSSHWTDEEVLEDIMDDEYL